MATTKTLKEELKKSDVKKNAIVSLKEFIDKRMEQIVKSLPAHINPERIIANFYSLFRKNPKLADCEPMSVLAGFMQIIQLGLEPNIHAYLIPFYDSDKKRYFAQMIMDYRGVINLVRRSGEIKDVYANPVYEKDEFDYCYGSTQFLKHKPTLGDRGKIIAFYSVAKFTSGETSFKVISKADVDKVMNVSPSKNSSYSPWKKWYEEQGNKTVIKKHGKFLPLSLEVQKMMATDETTKTEISPDIKELPDITDWANSSTDAPDIPKDVTEPELTKNQDGPKFNDIPTVVPKGIMAMVVEKINNFKTEAEIDSYVALSDTQKILEGFDKAHRAEIELEINRRKLAIKNTKDTFNL